MKIRNKCGLTYCITFRQCSETCEHSGVFGVSTRINYNGCINFISELRRTYVLLYRIHFLFKQRGPKFMISNLKTLFIILLKTGILGLLLKCMYERENTKNIFKMVLFVDWVQKVNNS